MNTTEFLISIFQESLNNSLTQLLEYWKNISFCLLIFPFRNEITGLVSEQETGLSVSKTGPIGTSPGSFFPKLHSIVSHPSISKQYYFMKSSIKILHQFFLLQILYDSIFYSNLLYKDKDYLSLSLNLYFTCGQLYFFSFLINQILIPIFVNHSKHFQSYVKF